MYSTNTTETTTIFPFPSTSTNFNFTLNNNTNSQNIDQINISSSPLSHHYGRRDKVVFFEMHFEEHQTQLTFAFCAVDPVAVICVFEEIHVNQLLYICVFGESLLNDAVTIVLYHTLHAMAAAGVDAIIWTDYLLAIIAFFWVSVGGILVGALWAVLTGIVTKFGAGVSVVQPLTCLLFPYLAYLIAESFGLSGILAIVVCGMGMKQYIVGNISEQSLVTVNYFMKTLSSSCEAVIFVFLGLSAVSKNHDLDFAFIFVTLFAIFIFRFISVGVLTSLVNKKRLQKIGIVDQFIMGYGGIRGAVCYGLVMSLNQELICCKNMLASTTIIVIVFTVFVQGGSIKKLVTYLKVKQHEVRKKTVFEMIADNVCSHIGGGVESIAGLRGNYWFRMTIERFNDKYLRPFITLQPEDRGMKLVKYNEEIQVTEAVSYLKKHGSFAGMPTVQSCRDLQLAQSLPPRMSISQRYLNTEQPLLGVVVPSSALQRPRENTIPRNESVSVFVRDKFAEMNSSAHRYSRHYLDGDFKNLQHSFSLAEDNNVDEDDEYYYKTYPNGKYNKKDLIIQMRKKSGKLNNNNNKELDTVPEMSIKFLSPEEYE
uniref:Sodium/hydrogen exchanger n=1 Tax=Meloidogyne hapla TaxID=6305 RepID=A0A1I8B4U3_MELHA